MASTFPTAVDSFTTKASGGTIAAAHVNDLQDAIVATQTAYRTGANVYHVEHFGAVGDGTTDDTAALQAAIDAAEAAGGGVVVFGAGTYRTTGSLYVTGNVSFRGVGRASAVSLDADITGSSKYWWQLGLPSLGGTTVKWSGFFVDLTFTCGAAGRSNHSFNVHYGEHYGWQRCLFDFTPAGNNPIGNIGCQNDGTVVAGGSTLSRQYAFILDNVFRFANNAGGPAEGIGHALCSYLWIVGNTTEGAGDDAIGVHFCDHVVVAHNVARSINGRIYISHGDTVTVQGNHLEYTAGANGAWSTGQGIMVELESALHGASQRILIADNTVVFPSSVTASNYAIRVIGGRSITVQGNTVLNYSADRRDISLESAALTGWTDPDGIEPDDRIRLRDIRVTDNKLLTPPGGTIGGGIILAVANGAYAPGPITIAHNAAYRYDVGFLSSAGGTFNDNTLDPAAAASNAKVAGTAVADALLLQTWYRGSVTASQTVGLVFPSGNYQGYWYAPTRFLVSRVVFTLQSAGGVARQTGGTVTATIYKNGVALIGPSTLDFTTNAYAAVYFGDTQAGLEQGDSISIVLITNGTYSASAASDIQAQLFGVPVKSS